MVFFNDSTNVFKDIVDATNSSTYLWRVAPLSSSWVFVNGSLPTDADGLTEDTTIVFEWHDVSKFGILQLNTFIFLMITVGVIIFLLFTDNVRDIVLGLNGKKFNFAPNMRDASTNERAFGKTLETYYPPPPPQAPLPSYTETVEKPHGAQVTSDEIRECQSIIRKVYSLKVDAYNARDAFAPSQPLVADMKRRANAGLAEIQSTVEEWASSRGQWTPQEWAKVGAIRERMRSIQPTPMAQFDTIEEIRRR